MIKVQQLKIIFFLLIVSTCVSCDQYTKQLAEEHLAYQKPIEFFEGAVKLVYAENTGAFLGLGTSLPPALKYIFLIFIPTFALYALTVISLKNSTTLMQSIGMSLIVAGGIGNLIDRIAYGSVIDFMNLGFQELRTGIFNFADLAITFGFLLLLFSIRKAK